MDGARSWYKINRVRYTSSYQLEASRCSWRNGLRKHRSGGVGGSVGLNHLSRLRLGKTHLARHSVDAARLRELCLGQPQLAILLAQLVANLLLRLDPVTALDGVEMLQAVDHRQQEEKHVMACREDGASGAPAPGQAP